ncbi:hypothetical protein V5R04_09150 [Jonesiaceae bacterium BS-20]|uniref:Uncharacterized protein n=1 Tax=Jonesiaceae bacterium BS-20 TaxID=3120821 RepID=A0AAU7DRU1_9MICO
MALFDRNWADQIDEKWRFDLRSVSLVTEVNFTDEELEHAIRFFAQQLVKNEPEQIAHHHPGIFLVAMTQLGSRSWEAQTFYQKVTNTVENVVGQFIDSRRKIEDATRCFSLLLKEFNLARLEGNSTSHRWIRPVLLHGAVPLDHLDELLDLIKRHIRKDPSITGESLVEFLRSHPSHLDREPMALRLFLLHGKEFTADYVSQVIDYASALPSNLPTHITDRLDEYIEEDHERSLIEFPRSERPVFALTPDGSIILRLPPVKPTNGSRAVDWHIRFGKYHEHIRTEVPYLAGAIHTEEASYYVPAPGVGASITRDDYQSEISLIDPKDPLLIFDGMGTLLSRTEAIPPGDVTLFWPATSGTSPLIDGTEVDGVSILPPFGWGSWRAQQLSVRQGSKIQFGDGTTRNIQTRDSKAQLVFSNVVTGIYTLDGMPVFATLPSVTLPRTLPLSEWTVLVRDSKGVVLTNFVPASFDFVVPISNANVPDKLAISIRGPLGRGITKTVPIVTDLASTFYPANRTLEPNGGIEKCTVRITRSDELIKEVLLKTNEFSTSFSLGTLKLKATPACEAYRLVEDDMDLPWSSSPEHITVKRARSTYLQVQGLTGLSSVTLAYTDNDAEPSSITKPVRRGNVEFNLRDFADAASLTNRGTLTLLCGDRKTVIGFVRPERLVEFGELYGQNLSFTRYSESPLTFTVFRTLQPWIPGEVIHIDIGINHVQLPEELLGNGPIRVFAELEDIWGSGPNTQYRRNSSNSKNYNSSWNMTLVSEPDVEICTLLIGQVKTITAPTRHTIKRAIQLIGQADAFREMTKSAQDDLLRLVTDHYSVSLEEIASLDCTEADKSRLLILSGLHILNHPVIQDSSLEKIARHSPTVAFLASRIDEVDKLHDHLLYYFTDQFGQELEDYWAGSSKNAAEGCWEPYIKTLSREQIKMHLTVLGAVPGLPLSGDNRILASSGLLISKQSPHIYSKRWVRVVARTAPVLQDSPLWNFVTQQTGGEDLCLPAASIALSLVARLAARGDKNAAQVYSDINAEHDLLSSLAPDLTYIDLIRAEAAIAGAQSK